LQRDPGVEPVEDGERDALAELVPAACSGDAAAIRKLVHELAPVLASPVRGILGAGHPDVEDVLQDCLYQVLQALPSFRGDASVKHFAHVITARRAVEARRRSTKVRAGQEAFERMDDPADRVVAPHDAGGDRVRELLASLLDELPPAQQETVSLRFFAGLSIEEIAQATNVPANTVRSRLRLAKDHIRDRIETDSRLQPLREVAS
jgi:RNA polymerase sigma factor (sigma-70 family)